MLEADKIAKEFCGIITANAENDDERKRLLLEARGLDEGDFGDWPERTLEEIIALFTADRSKNCSVCTNDADRNELFFEDVKRIPEGNWCLEPFIARYVKALNAIGLNTDWSCDGNHRKEEKKNRIQIGFPNRLSLLWHVALCRHYPALQNGLVWRLEDAKKAHHTRMIVCEFNSQNQLHTYVCINKTAEKIEVQKDALLEIKEKLHMALLYSGIDLSEASDGEIMSIMEKQFVEE